MKGVFIKEHGVNVSLDLVCFSLSKLSDIYIVSMLERLMPAVLQALKERKDLFTTEVYLLSAITALQRTAETLPHFISPYLENTILQVRYTTIYRCISIR